MNRVTLTLECVLFFSIKNRCLEAVSLYLINLFYSLKQIFLRQGLPRLIKSSAERAAAKPYQHTTIPFRNAHKSHQKMRIKKVCRFGATIFFYYFFYYLLVTARRSVLMTKGHAAPVQRAHWEHTSSKEPLTAEQWVAAMRQGLLVFIIFACPSLPA